MVRICLVFSLLVSLFPALIPGSDYDGLQTPRESLLVSAAWLADHMKDPNLVLLHVGDKTEFGVRHIPGARFVALNDISATAADTGGLNLELLPAPALRSRLVDLGISNSSRIIVYYATTQITQATRVMLTLDYAGLGDKSSLLDGGMGAWVAAGNQVTSDSTAIPVGTLAPLTLKPVAVDAAFVKRNLTTAGTSIVDARLTPFYDGTQTGGSQQAPHKTGHIEGAKSIPYVDLTTDQQTFRPATELQDRFARAGVKPGDTVIAYCHLGQQATAVVFAARTLGYKVVLYDGSFEDWSKQPEAPVATTIKKDR